MKKYIPWVAALALGLILGLAMNYFNTGVERIRQVKVISHDTVYQVIPRQPIIAKLKAKKIEYDTISEAVPVRPFTASADSLINGDSISISYSYPTNTFDFSMRRKADTVIKTQIDILAPDNQTGSSVWETILYVVAGLLCGTLITLAVGG